PNHRERPNGITIRAPVARRADRQPRRCGMRTRRVLALGITALFIAGACGGSTPAASSAPTVAASVAPTASPTPIKIKSSYGNVTPANLAPFMAKELGLFEKRGLDVELSLIDGGAPSAAALVSNQTQVGNFGGTEAMSGFVGGSDMQVVALFVPVTPWQFLAKADYKTPADLKGKTIGVAIVGGSAYAAPGHPPDTVKLLVNGFKVIYDLNTKKITTTDNYTITPKSQTDKN